MVEADRAQHGGLRRLTVAGCSALSAFTPDAAAALGGPPWLRTRRVAAAERFASSSLPDESEEIWRYSRISELDLERYLPLDGAASSAPEAQPALSPALAAAGQPAALVVVHNGRVARVEVDPDLAARGLMVADAAGLADGDGDGVVDEHQAGVLGHTSAGDVFSDLNTAFLGGATLVRVPPGLVVGRPVVVSHWVDADRRALFPRTVVQAGADSELTVVEHQASADVAAFVDPLVDLDVGDAARVRYLNVQDWGPRVWQVGYQVSRVGRDATLEWSVVALGGDYARVRTDSRIDGRGGTSHLNAVYFADRSRMHDFRTLQDHAAPSSTSDLLFKGAVQDRARSVYSGLIRVQKDARGTNAFQTNRNLVLSEGASAESVPNLEIETNDVRCSHASAVGPIDEEQLYYLESRGIPPQVAERLVVLGFFGEVLDRLPSPPLVERLKSIVAERLVRREA